jgi:predicted RNA-binding protein YlxR (DUF448 family)
MRRRSDGVVVPDVARTRSGRSAWVCPTRKCLASAVRRRAFHRALSGPHKLAVRDPELATLVANVEDAVESRLALLRRTSTAASAAHGNSAQISALAALQSSLQAAGEVA